jgi:hypothetical protein
MTEPTRPGRARVAVLLVLLALLAACGSPGANRPVIDGDGPSRLGARSDLTNDPPAGPEGIHEPRQLVRTYLLAAAGRAENRAARLREFLDGDEQRTWSPGRGETVVVRTELESPTNLGLDRYEVRATLTPVGILDGRGSLLPPHSTAPIHVVFKANLGGDQAHLTQVPPGILLDVDALTTYYSPHTVYFWTRDGDPVLVPDLRYLPKFLPAEQTIVDYLLAGPSSLLADVVKPALGPGVELIGRPAIVGGKLVINLPAKAAGNLDDLMAQLRWSLRPEYTGHIDLQILGNSTPVNNADTECAGGNPSTRRQEEPDRFAIVAGKIVAVPAGGAREPTGLPDVVHGPVNRNVVSAAISRDRQQAALVQHTATGNTLVLVRTSGTTQSPVPTSVRGSQLSRPVLVNGPAENGVLVTVDGALNFVSMNGRSTLLRVPGRSRITAVSAAPDGRRIALVADGQLYLTALTAVDGRTQVTGARRVETGVPDLVGVAWTREERLVVAAATAESTQLREVSVDGALRDDRMPHVGQVSQIVAYVDNPCDGDTRGPIMYQQDNLSFALFLDTPYSLVSAEGSSKLTAPFYLDYS